MPNFARKMLDSVRGINNSTTRNQQMSSGSTQTPSQPLSNTTLQLPSEQRPLPEDLRRHPDVHHGFMGVLGSGCRIDQYLPRHSVEELREMPLELSRNGVSYKVKLRDLLPEFGLDRIYESNLAKSALSVKNLKEWQDYLKIATTMIKTGDELLLLQSLVRTAMTKLPEHERFAAWQSALEAVLKPMPTGLATTPVISPSGWENNPTGETGQSAVAGRRAAIYELARSIEQLLPDHRVKAWDGINELLGGPHIGLNNNEIAGTVSRLLGAIPFLFPDKERMSDQILQRYNDAKITLLVNSGGVPLPFGIMANLMSAASTIAEDKVRNLEALELLKSMQFKAGGDKKGGDKKALAQLLKKSSQLVWSMGIPTAADGYLPSSTEFPDPQTVPVSASSKSSSQQSADLNEGSPLLAAHAHPVDLYGIHECPLVRGIQHFFNACAVLDDQGKLEAVRTLVAHQPPVRAILALDAMSRAALTSKPPQRDVSEQYLLSHRGKMLGAVLGAVKEAFTRGSVDHRKANWFRPEELQKGIGKFPAFMTARVQKACEIIAALADNKQKLGLLGQLVDMFAWADRYSGHFYPAVTMVKAEIDAIPYDYPGRNDLLASLGRRYLFA